MQRIARCIVLPGASALLSVCGGSEATLQAPAVALTVAPSTLTVQVGASGAATLMLARTTFAGAVTLSLVSPPAGVTSVFTPAPVTGTGATLTLSVASSVAPGNYTITIRGTAPGISDATASLVLTVLGSAWSVTRSGNTLELAYGSGTNFPQYASLHLKDSYFRLNPGPGSGWGTSIILLPAFWSGGQLFQGSPLTYTSSIQNNDMIIAFSGSILSLQFSGSVRVSPPTATSIAADVTISVGGNVALDTRPGEAFQFAKLSSMHISATRWDAQSALVDGSSYAIPAQQWILNPPATGRTFGLLGGTSAWKTLAPTIEVTLDQPGQITGWVTPSADPNDDNVGLWAATATIVRQIHYSVVARR